MESDDADQMPGQFGGMDGSAAQPVQGIMERRNGRAMEKGEPGTDCLPMVHANQGIVHLKWAIVGGAVEWIQLVASERQAIEEVPN